MSLRFPLLVLLLLTACDSSKAAPAKSEPAKSEIAKADPAKAEPAKIDPAKVEPAKVDVVAAQPTPAPAEEVKTAVSPAPGDADGSDVDAAMKQMGLFADDMCKCKDSPCADKVTAAMVKYAEEIEKKYAGKGEPKVTDEQTKTMEATVKRLTECTVKAMGG